LRNECTAMDSRGHRPLAEMVALVRVGYRLAVLHEGDGLARSFATLALAAAVLGIETTLLPDQTELGALVLACVANITGPPALRNASCLALVVFLMAPAYPQSLRVHLLQTIVSQQLALEFILGHEDDGSRENDVGAALESAPVLLYLLLLLRNQPHWLDMELIARHVRVLARVAQTQTSGPCQLLALRVTEALLAKTSSIPPCQSTLLQHLLADDTHWKQASSAARSVSRGQVLTDDCIGAKFTLDRVEVFWLPHLLTAALEMLCAWLGG